MNTWIKKIVLLTPFLLSGCISPVNTNYTRYQLTASPHVCVKRTHNATLLVLKPETNTIYSTTQMAYTKQPYEIAYFAKNRWADTPANMLQQLMIQSLQSTHYYRAIITPTYTAHFDYVLSTQLVELKQDFTQHPSIVRIKLRAQLIQASTSRVLRAKQFSVTAPAPQDSPAGGVMAANRAVDQLLKELNAFCTK